VLARRRACVAPSPQAYSGEIAVFDRMIAEKRRIRLSLDVYAAIYRQTGILEWLGRQPVDEPALEIGSWDGLHLFNLWRLTERPGLGIDISARSLQAAEQSAREADLPIRFAVMDARQTGLKNNQFHTIVFFNTLHHFFSQGFDEVLAETRRLLHPKGRVFITEVSLLYPYYALAFCGARLIKRFARLDCIERNFTDNEMALWPGKIRRHANRVGLRVVPGSVGFVSYVTRHPLPPEDPTPRLFRAVARALRILGRLGPPSWKHDCLHMTFERPQ